MRLNKKKTLTLIVLVISIVSCGKISKQIKNEIVNPIENIIEPKLSKEQLNFCENYFISNQISSGSHFQAINSLLNAVRLSGFEDVISAFTIPHDYNYEQQKAYSQSVLQDLGFDSEQLFGYTDIHTIFRYIYNNSKLRKPELKTLFVEELDNGSKIWLVKDYQSMTQARLIVKKDGSLSIGNLTGLKTVITH